MKHVVVISQRPSFEQTDQRLEYRCFTKFSELKEDIALGRLYDLNRIGNRPGIMRQSFITSPWHDMISFFS